MIFILGLAFVTAAMNVAITRGVDRATQAASARFGWLQSAGFAIRFVVIFGMASWVWFVKRDAKAVALFIVVGAVAQTAGQIYLLTGKTRLMCGRNGEK